MIYLTGDTHGGFQRLNSKNFSEQKEMTKDDYLIICSSGSHESRAGTNG